VGTRPDSLVPLLAAGGKVRGVDQTVQSELGFTVGLWNGNDVGVGLMITCGSYSQRVANAAVLSLPRAEGEAIELYRPEVARVIVAALAEAWDPEWATWTSNALRRAQAPRPREPVVGWLTYLRAGHEFDAKRLPPGVTAETAPNGTLVAIGRSIADASEQAVLAERQALGLA
jgi:hypothetical protein